MKAGVSKKFHIQNNFEVLPIAIITILLGALYYPIFIWLISQWNKNPMYSHGFLVPFISCCLGWVTIKKIDSKKDKQSWLGLVMIVVGLSLELFCILVDVKTTASYSLIIVILGLILYFYGKTLFKAMLFPVGFMVFMVPLHQAIIKPISFQMKLFATKVAVVFAESIGIPVVRDGVRIHLSQGSLQVADPCSGIQSLIALLALGAVFSYLYRGSVVKKIILFLMTIPFAIFSNMCRIIFLTTVSEFYGIDGTVNGPMHSISGFIVFLIAFVCLFGVGRLLSCLGREKALSS